MADENTVYIGNKETMAYVMAVVNQFNNGSDEVFIKARGRAISKAVDVAEITKNRFLKEANITEIETDTEEIEQEEEDRTVNVSSMSITVSLEP
ncbi:MAG: DNA-binding protein Alba [Candidatus Saliniplasma sp.]